MAKTDITAINAKTISINGVPITGSGPATGPTTNFDALDADTALALNGVLVAGTLAQGGQYTNYTDINVNQLSVAETPYSGGGVVITLKALGLSASLQVGTAVSGTITNATAGSTITASIPGITINSAARTFSGTPTTAASYNLTETLAGAANSPRTTSVTVAAAGGQTTTFRTQDTQTYGTSTYGNAHREKLTNIAGTVTVPAQFVNVFWQGRAADLVPTQTGKTIPLGTNYGNETGIKTAIDAAISGGTLTPTVKVIFGGANQTIDTDTDFNIFSVDKDIITALKAAGVQKYMCGSIFYRPGLGDYFNSGVWYRRMSYFLNNPHPYRGLFSFHEAHMRSAEEPGTNGFFVQSDYDAIRAGERPDSLTYEGQHDLGIGYQILGNYYAKVERGLEGGIPFLPTLDYFARVTAPGFVTNLFYTGDLTGVTATVDDARFTVTVEDNPAFPTDPRPKLLKLFCSSIPTKANVRLKVTLSKGGLGSEWYTVSVSISQRAANVTAPARARFRNRTQLSRWQPYGRTSDTDGSSYFPANTRKFSMVFIIRMEEDDGLNYQGVPAGSADTRSQYLMTMAAITGQNVIEMRRSTTGGMVIRVQDDSTGNVNAISTTVGLFRKAQGMRALFVSYDADQPAKCLTYCSASTNPANAYAAVSTAITPAGTGTLGLAKRMTTQAGGFTIGSRIRDGALTAEYAEFTKENIWVATDFIDFSVAANRALFFNEATQSAVDLGNATGTVLGITPHLYLPGDAAEIFAGGREIDPSDVVNGGIMCPNKGSGPGLMTQMYGELETVS